MDLDRIEAVIEAVLFTMGDSVEVEKLAAAIEHDVDTTRKIVHNMMDRYEAANSGIRIIELENAFQLCTKTEYYDELIKVASQPRKYVLTDVLLETLSIIAYKQPITKLEIEKIRGVSCDHAVNKLVEYGEQLAEISTLFKTQPELKAFMSNPQIQPSAKKELLNKVFGSDIEKSVHNFMLLLIDKRRIALIEEIVGEYEALSNEVRNIVVAHVTTAVAMEKPQEKALTAKLEAITGKHIQLKTHIDKSIIGGVVVKMGDKLIDGSVTSKIKSLGKQLMAN